MEVVMRLNRSTVGVGLLTAVVGLAAPRPASAHCDSLDGPVVTEARAALEAGDVARVLKWVAAEREAEIREAFSQAAAVRGLGPQARRLADRYFFETLVRVHREGEGAPFSGLKPAGTSLPAAAAADAALAEGAVEPLLRAVAARTEAGLRERFARATAARARSGESTEAGRAYVAAYVDFVHYAERLWGAATPDARHAEHEAAP